MNEGIKERISALVDGELSEFETRRVLEEIETNLELKDYWKKITPKYEFINASDVLGKRNFQTKYDSGSGYCAVWSGIFAHYRILNPDTPLKDLMNHIDKKIKVANLLKYARYVEDTVKRKI